MLLILITAAFLLALGLQLRARPAVKPAGYYLGADGVICMTSWKVVERHWSAPPASPPAPAVAPALPVGPWGARVPATDPVTAQAEAWIAQTPLALLAAPIRFEAADLAACLEDDTVRPSNAIVIPADLLAELDRAQPPAWSRRWPAEASSVGWQDEPAAPGLEAFLATPAHSLALH